MDLGLLQREVAAEIGVHVQTVALWDLWRSVPMIGQCPGNIRFLG